jgi:hypothetical protein
VWLSKSADLSPRKSGTPSPALPPSDGGTGQVKVQTPPLLVGTQDQMGSP